ncbi:MAG: hypothetical protein ACTSQ8_16920 [Candidatus Helarchaeota archaeon]
MNKISEERNILAIKRQIITYSCVSWEGKKLVWNCINKFLNLKASKIDTEILIKI